LSGFSQQGVFGRRRIPRVKTRIGKSGTLVELTPQLCQQRSNRRLIRVVFREIEEGFRVSPTEDFAVH
jgi:hypothetical protein